MLTKKMAKEKRFPAIVYVTLQQTAEQVATHLSKQGIHARAYHAGLPDEHRSEVQEQFMGGEVDVIVATIAFGMGIDKANIRAVYHYNLPKTLENYQQEIGRAGRDGNASHCEMMACGDDLIVLENFVYGDTPTPAAVRQLMDHLLRKGEEFDISRYELTRVTDIRPLVLETVLTYLELDGVLTPLGAFYSGYQVRFVHGEARLLSGHTPERREFLQRLFDSGKRGYKWITINPEESAQAIGESRDRILKALSYLEESGDVELKPSGMRHRYRLVAGNEKPDIAALCQKMQKLFIERERKDAERLALVTDFAETASCLTRHLLRYFGEDLEADCGHCGCCLETGDKAAGELPQSPEPAITLEQVEQIQQVIAEGHAALRAPRQMARYLCGLTSPATTRDRLTRKDAFGMLEHYPFLKVLDQTESMMTA